MTDEMAAFTGAAIRQAIAKARAEGITEGERRATAAIVAWLREPVMGGDNHEPVNQTNADAADDIERGEHLPAKPLDT